MWAVWNWWRLGHAHQQWETDRERERERENHHYLDLVMSRPAPLKGYSHQRTHLGCRVLWMVSKFRWLMQTWKSSELCCVWSACWPNTWRVSAWMHWRDWQSPPRAMTPARCGCCAPCSKWEATFPQRHGQSSFSWPRHAPVEMVKAVCSGTGSHWPGTAIVHPPSWNCCVTILMCSKAWIHWNRWNAWLRTTFAKCAIPATYCVIKKWLLWSSAWSIVHIATIAPFELHHPEQHKFVWRYCQENMIHPDRTAFASRHNTNLHRPSCVQMSWWQYCPLIEKKNEGHWSCSSYCHYHFDNNRWSISCVFVHWIFSIFTHTPCGLLPS